MCGKSVQLLVSERKKERKLHENTDLIGTPKPCSYCCNQICATPYTLGHYWGNVRGSNKITLVSTFLNIKLTYNDPHEVI